MSLITGSDVGRYFGAQDVFQKVTFSIEYGDHSAHQDMGAGRQTSLVMGIETPPLTPLKIFSKMVEPS